MSVRTLVIVAAASAGWFGVCPVHAATGDQTVVAATEVLKDLVALPADGIPAALLAEAYGVAIIPNTIKLGLVIGGQRGRGVVVVKEKDGNWRAPSFITMTGGSVGFQIGAQGSDIVLVFKTQKSVEGLMKGTLKIGADASAAAGPVGRRFEAATDAQLKAEIYSYSRSRGLFAGIALDGSVIEVDSPANAAYYGTVEQGQTVPPAAANLVMMIAQLAGHPVQAAPAAAAAPAAEPKGVQWRPAGGPLAPAPQGSANADLLKQQLANSAIQLNRKLDTAWQQYLALPAEVYREGNPPALPGLKNAQARYEAVMADARYRTLSQQPEFQAARNSLQAYVAALSPAGEAKLNLPPPPTSGQR